MAGSRRPQWKITYDIFKCIEDKDGRALRNELYGVLGSNQQLTSWIDEDFVVNGFLVESKEGRYTFYSMTENGNLLYRALKINSVFKKLKEIL